MNTNEWVVAFHRFVFIFMISTDKIINYIPFWHKDNYISYGRVKYFHFVVVYLIRYWVVCFLFGWLYCFTGILFVVLNLGHWTFWACVLLCNYVFHPMHPMGIILDPLISEKTYLHISQTRNVMQVKS